MSETRNDSEFWDDLAMVVDGEQEPVERHADLLSSSDAHRDARHEAEAAANLVADAGLDYEPIADLEAKVAAALDARGPSMDQVRDTENGVPSFATAAEAGETAPPAGDSGPIGQPSDQPRAHAEQKPTTVERKLPSTKASAGGGAKILIFGGLAAAAAALLAFAGWGAYSWLSPSESGGTQAVASIGTLSATISRLERASDDGQQGVSVQVSDGAWAPTTTGAALAAGTHVRTDERTRAQMDLSDGSVVTLDRDTEIVLSSSAVRRLDLVSGQIVADVAHIEAGPDAVYGTPTGHVEVLGTKFVLSATEELASVRVARGTVRAEAATGGVIEVKAGNEGLLPKSGAPSVEPTTNLAADVAWSELSTAEDATEQGIRGLGELRARRPGEREDHERPLSLSYHKSTIRIVGNVARTEIEEVFRNDDDATLEGIYRFPLPPDARIASLELLVDGEWQVGAFVEKDRAQRIWRGVIRNATPEHQRQQNEEFIWVPGPWRDPALLEWQRGGRFELRIFPIPAHGERRMRLSYTQTLAPHGHGGRRYVHPLPFSSDESTRVGHFEVDARVAGNEGDVRTNGYEMATGREGEATTLRFAADDFMPKGDLVLDYDLSNPDAEIRWWTYQGTATAAPPEHSREVEADVLDAHRALHADSRGYAVFAIRPDLPAWSEQHDRDYVLVVDSSQSMVGERWDRATELTARVISEMDRRDRFMLLACDATCQTMSDVPSSPSAQAATQVRTFLGAVRPAGASDIVAAMRSAVRAIADKRNPERDVRVLYVGDGIASVGHRRASSLSAEVADLVADDGQLSFTTVGIGGDADTVNLSAIAGAGGGHYVPYVPGQSVGTAALAILETTYGASLAGATVELPDGITDVAPTRLPTIRAGEELLVVGRMERSDIRGDIVLHGKVAGRAFEDRYPVSVTASTALGNAFVPREWAAARIADLELAGRGEDRAKIIAMSKAFGVMSRHTSLLVLESEAMFRAFGVDRAQPTVQWTGNEDMEMGEGEGLAQYADGDADDALGGDAAGGLGLVGTGRGGAGSGHFAAGPSVGLEGQTATGASVSRAHAAAPPARMRMDARDAPATAADEAAEPEMPMQEAQRRAPVVPAASQPAPRPPVGRAGGQWMRREWYREGAVATDASIPSRWSDAVAQAEAALRESPDSRDRHRDLVRALSRAGELERAREVVDAWIERDRMDPEALTYLSDIVGRDGRRDESVRLLSGIVDLAPDNATLHERMANAFDRAGMPERACAHRVSLAEIRSNDGAAQVAALRCERALGRAASATRLLSALTDETMRHRVEDAAAQNEAPSRIRGEIMMDATWGGSTDVDLSLVTPEGTRISWMGGRTTVVGENGTRIGGERLGLRRAATGSYLLEVDRVSPTDTTPVSGRIQVTVLGERQTIPFTLTGERVAVGRVDVVRRSRLVPVQ